MVKRKFKEARRKEVGKRLISDLEPRTKIEEVIKLVRGYGFEVEVHNSEEDSGYWGFYLYFDAPYDRTWIIVKNPNGGPDLELGIESDFEISFGDAGWSFGPSREEYGQFVELIKAILECRAADVSLVAEGKNASSALLMDEPLDDTGLLGLIKRVSLRDYYGNDLGIEGHVSPAHLQTLRNKLRLLRNRNVLSAAYTYWDPAKNRSMTFEDMP